MTLRELLTTGSPRVGLVLGGGGAKGAYQIGVLRYLLQEAGVNNFEFIAGTSIGSLNALLIATATPADAEKVWRDLGKALRPGANMLPAILWYAGLYGALFLPILLTGIFAILFAASWFGWPVRSFGPSVAQTMFLGLLCSAIGILLVGYQLRTFEFMGRVHAFTFNPAATLFFPGMALVVALSWAGPFVFTSYPLGWILFWAFAAVGFWTAWTIGIFFVSKRARTHSLFDNSEVRRMVEERLKVPVSAWRCKRILATVARERQFYHPAMTTDEYSESWKRTTGQTDQPGKLVTRWVPEYVDLMEMPHAEQVATLLDTSAIPIAFPIRRDQRGFWTTDGGIVDNLPITAALNMGECDIIFVVPVNQNEMPNAKGLQDYVDERWAKATIPTLTAQQKHALMRDAEAAGGPWMPRLSGRRDVASRRFIIVEPTSPLCTTDFPVARFFSGTLNFGQTALARWIELGFVDCKNQLERQVDA